MAKSLTAANAIITLGATGLFPVAQQIQGFAADDVFDAEALDSAEAVMGVDGRLSGGWIPNPVKIGFSVQADSDSVDFFETLYQSQQQARDLYYLFGSVYLKATEKKYTLVKGIMTNYKPLPDAKKILQPRKFMITFESVSQAAI